MQSVMRCCRTPILNPTTPQQFPDQVVYLDIYATWCGPCRGEAPYHAEIYIQFKGQRVVFVNLCMRSAPKEWQKTIRELNYHGEHYYADDDASAIIMSACELYGFPTYMLFDRSGRLVNQQAPRPSEKEELTAQIKALLP